MAASISFAHVSKRYPGSVAGSAPALDDACFDVAAGEFVFLTGHSGAGKSTVFRLLAAIERPSGGTVLVNRQNVGGLPASAVPFFRRNLGLVLQDQRLLFDRSVFDNVLLPLAVAGVAPRDAARRARAALDKVGLLGRERANPITLSGGEQQRVSIARAVVNRPALLLADEPTANLDADYASLILELFRSFHDVGATVMLATHDAALMARHDARRIVLAQGRVVP
ncbi:MAG TPA: ATP-binding cassette domain-containing protein [Casimicrobiaceae bacterium]|nr:ATP-binding cassette domain-containing protein [Casimicrobiaceae bacterium]